MAVLYTDYDVCTHHTNMETLERLSEADLMESAIVLATLVYHAAMRDEKIPRESSKESFLYVGRRAVS